MKRTCQRLQRILAEHGPTALRDDAAAQRHLEECTDCFTVLEGLAELDVALEELPLHDAPDELVESLLSRPELRETAGGEARPASRLAALWALLRQPIPPGRRRGATAAVALLAVTVIAVVGFRSLSTRTAPSMPGESQRLGDVAAYEPVSVEEAESDRGPAGEEQPHGLKAIGARDDETAAAAPSTSALSRRPPPPPPPPALSPAPPKPERRKAESRSEKKAPAAPKADERAFANRKEAEQDRVARRRDAPSEPTPDPSVIFEPDIQVFEDTDRDDTDLVYTDLPDVSEAFEISQATQGVANEWQISGGFIAAPGDREVGGKDQVAPTRPSEVVPEPGPDELSARDKARRFLHRRARLDGLRLQPASGYWSNTYVPGDPALRHLQARLLGRDRTALEAYSETALRLHDGARQTTQPFDPPTTAALAVYLHADRRQARGETRMLVQVGLKGTERHSGRRPTMNVSVVLDATGEISAEVAAALRALVAAFGQARDLGDRFRLVVAGRPGAMAVGPEAFRHGPLTVAVESLLGSGEKLPGQTLDLPLALRVAIQEVSSSDDPTTPLGSSVAVLLTSRALGADARALSRLAHDSAVAGVPVSVVGIGDGVRLDELDSIALAGQGNRRLLSTPREAPNLVDRELSAVSRVIARAVRLRIRLAPGVQLVDVIGSRRLDTVSAERVREAERSIDRRLSRNLGIQADRGDDEAGIQIVLPSFYAGDAHVVLLDVVASGPGAIADVRVRYKDLVHLENGQARAQLSMERGDAEPDAPWARGPLELNVLKNLLAYRLRDVLEQAGASIAAGQSAVALQRLGEFRQLLQGLGFEVQGFDQDRDLARDVAMLDEYVRLLASGAIQESEQLRHLAESMRYAGRLKVLPRPVPAGGEP